MKKAYQILAGLVALEVMAQAAFMAWALFGFGKWIDDGNVFNKEMLDDESGVWHFTEERGFMFHGISGMMVIPLTVLILFIISFFAKVPRGVAMAGTLVVLVILQVWVFAALGHDTPFFGALHGFNALLIFGTAVMATKTSATDKQAEPAIGTPA